MSSSESQEIKLTTRGWAGPCGDTRETLHRLGDQQVCLIIEAVRGKFRNCREGVTSPLAPPLPKAMAVLFGCISFQLFLGVVFCTAERRGKGAPHEGEGHPPTPFSGPTRFTTRSRVVTLGLLATGLHLVSGHIFTGQWSKPHLRRCVRSLLGTQGLQGGGRRASRHPGQMSKEQSFIHSLLGGPISRSANLPRIQRT